MWSSLSHPYEISRLLAGHKVTLLADIEESVVTAHHKMDALKFSTLNMEIEVFDAFTGDLNHTVNSLLGECFVEMTHSGQSFYSFQQKTYMIDLSYLSASPANKLMLRYKYGARNAHFSNDSHRKLVEDKSVLSPYTFWELQIVPVNERSMRDIFKRMASALQVTKRDQREIRVYLTGHGEYLKYYAKQSDCQIY